MGIIKFAAIAVASSLVLSGCSSLGKSAAWQQGYKDQSSISADKMDNFITARVYCETLLANLYPNATADEAYDYTQGCLSYVYTGDSGDSGSASEDTGDSTDSGTEDSGTDFTSGMLDRLNSAGYSVWDYDPVNNTSGIPAIEVILGEDSDDGSTCAVWVFQDEATANQEAENGDFNWVDGNFWYGVDDYGYGAILIADYADDNCAIDASDALNWNLE